MIATTDSSTKATCFCSAGTGHRSSPLWNTSTVPFDVPPTQGAQSFIPNIWSWTIQNQFPRSSLPCCCYCVWNDMPPRLTFPRYNRLGPADGWTGRLTKGPKQTLPRQKHMRLLLQKMWKQKTSKNQFCHSSSLLPCADQNSKNVPSNVAGAAFWSYTSYLNIFRGRRKILSPVWSMYDCRRKKTSFRQSIPGWVVHMRRTPMPEQHEHQHQQVNTKDLSTKTTKNTNSPYLVAIPREPNPWLIYNDRYWLLSLLGCYHTGRYNDQPTLFDQYVKQPMVWSTVSQRNYPPQKQEWWPLPWSSINLLTTLNHWWTTMNGFDCWLTNSEPAISHQVAKFIMKHHLLLLILDSHHETSSMNS